MKGLKSKSANTLVWILMAMLILGLGGFGITNFGGGVTAIGSVGDREIAVNDYARALQQEMAAITQQTGQTLSMEQATAFGLDRVVRQRLVTEAALDNEAARVGLSVGDARLLQEITAMPAFQGVNGAFDRDTYRMTLQQSRLKETEFEDKVRGDIARTVLQGATLAGVDAPAGYTERLFTFIGEKREASYVRLTEDDLAAPLPAPVDTDLQAYYEAHAADFTQPEAKRITYAALLPEMLRDEVVVDDAALRALYDERRDEFFQPERRLVERLAFATEDEAEAARTAIDAGTTSFDTLVTDRGLTLADVDLGEATETGLGAAGAAVFALNEPGIAGPVATDLGPALFRVNAILEAQETTFEDARDDLTAEFAQDAARRLIGDKVEAIDDALAGGATVEDLAREQGMEVSTVDYYPGLVEGIAAYEDFRKAAEALAEGDFAEAILLDDGGVVAMRLDEVVPPTLKPFADVADAVEDGWHGEALSKALGAQAEEVVARIAAGEPFGGFGLVTRTGTQTRGGYIDAVPDAMLAEMFTMKPGDMKTIPGDGAVFLLRLDTVEPASTDDEDGKAVHDAIAAQLSQSLAGDAFDLFAAALEAEAGISLNQAAINAVHAQFR